MTVRARNVMWLLPLLLTACVHPPKPQLNQQYAPPVSTVPKPPVLHPDLPLAVLTLPSESVETDTDSILEASAKPAIRRKKPAVKATSESPESAPSSAGSTQQAASDTPPEESAIGVLSSGDPPDLRRETTDTIADTERGLKDLGRNLNNQEQKTAAQIRQFIRQARKALGSGDVDGAHTLAAKAKVLLSELSE
jgi:hypothetical protein